MTAKDFETVQEIVLAKLDGLSPTLTYHCKNHTFDVMEQAIRIAMEEGVGEDDLLMLKFAALFHDIGFLNTYANHEAEGCQFFLRMTAGLHFTETEKETMLGLIMATKIPQRPQNQLQRIICDADLDYLGRDDFFTIGDTLRREFLHYKIVPDNEAWEKLQLNFLTNHRYHTLSSQQLREPVKQAHLAKLLQ
jgi:uncharacterized protein